MGYKRSRLKISSPTGNTTAARGKDTARDRRLNRRKYAQLLSRTLPRIIENDAELRQVTENVEPLLDKGARRTPEEEALCRLLIRLIEALLESRNLRQVNLLPIFGSRSRVSDAVSGKREISKSQARKLGEFFSVSPDLFI